MGKLYPKFGILILIHLSCAGWAELRADDLNEDLVRIDRRPSSLQIENLEVPSESEIIIKKSRDKKKKRFYIVIEGSHKRPHWSLLHKKKFVKFDEEGRFRIPVRIRGKHTPVSFIAIGPEGTIETETLNLKANWKELTRPPSETRFSFNAGLGYTMLTLNQTNLAVAFEEQAITLKGGVSYKLSEKWNTSIGGYVTALPLTTQSVTTWIDTYEDQQLRFGGFNFRVGYLLSQPEKPLQLRIHAGVYGLGMRGSDAFGIPALGGPQLFPTLSYRTANGNVWSTYLKYSPIANKFNLFKLSNAERAVGVSYEFFKALSLTLDYSNLELLIEEDVKTPILFTIQTTTFGFSLSF